MRTTPTNIIGRGRPSLRRKGPLIMNILGYETIKLTWII